VSPYLRTVKTSSGATAVQIVHSSRRGSRDIEHRGSAHDHVELELLKAAARQRLAAGQGELDLSPGAGVPGGPLPITASRMACLLDALEHAWRKLGFDQATGGDEVFRQLVMARIIGPVSKLSKERRLEPQITIGLLTGADGFPLMVSAFEGNRAETRTMLPVIESFMAAHQLPDVTVVADAGMVSEANQKQIEAAGLSFILGARIPHVPYLVAQWRREHPGQDIPDGQVFTQPWPAGPNGGRRDQVIYYQYRADRPAGRCAASTSR
jgi:Transposase DDE domain